MKEAEEAEEKRLNGMSGKWKASDLFRNIIYRVYDKELCKFEHAQYYEEEELGTIKGDINECKDFLNELAKAYETDER